MDLVLYEDSLKYDLWVKILIAFPIVLLIALGILFYIDANDSDVFPSVSEKESNTAFVILFASVLFVLVVYGLVLPRKIYILQDRIKIKFGIFFWNVSFDTIESVKAAKGIPVFWIGFSSITSYSRQIEIIRKNGWDIRISPSRRDQFLEYVDRALSAWKRTHGI